METLGQFSVEINIGCIHTMNGARTDALQVSKFVDLTSWARTGKQFTWLHQGPGLNL